MTNYFDLFAMGGVQVATTSNPSPQNGQIWCDGTHVYFRQGGISQTWPAAAETIIFKEKTANETVTSSTAIQDDDHLFASLGANETWDFWLIQTSTVSSGGFRFAFSYSGSATGGYERRFDSTSTIASNFTNRPALTTETTHFGGSGHSSRLNRVIGTISTTTSGTFRLRWAQNGSHFIGMTLPAGTLLLMIKRP
jgi:hypothetical protein